MFFILIFSLLLLSHHAHNIAAGKFIAFRVITLISDSDFKTASNHTTTSQPPSLRTFSQGLPTYTVPTLLSHITSSAPQCTECTLQALNPVTLTYPSSVVANTTITTATVLAFPTYYPGGSKLYSISYQTITVTEVVPNNQTSIVSTTWTTYDATLYVLDSDPDYPHPLTLKGHGRPLMSVISISTSKIPAGSLFRPQRRCQPISISGMCLI